MNQVTLGHADCAQLLLDCGANANHQDKKGRTYVIIPLNFNLNDEAPLLIVFFFCFFVTERRIVGRQRDNWRRFVFWRSRRMAVDAICGCGAVEAMWHCTKPLRRVARSSSYGSCVNIRSSSRSRV